MIFTSLYVGLWLLNLWGDWFLQEHMQNDFLKSCVCLYLQPSQICSFSWHCLSQIHQTNKTFWGRKVPLGMWVKQQRRYDYWAGRRVKVVFFFLCVTVHVGTVFYLLNWEVTFLTQLHTQQQGASIFSTYSNNLNNVKRRELWYRHSILKDTKHSIVSESLRGFIVHWCKRGLGVQSWASAEHLSQQFFWFLLPWIFPLGIVWGWFVLHGYLWKIFRDIFQEIIPNPRICSLNCLGLIHVHPITNSKVLFVLKADIKLIVLENLIEITFRPCNLGWGMALAAVLPGGWSQSQLVYRWLSLE